MTDCVVTRHEQPHLLRGVHGGTCPGDTCEGCAPAPALPGLLVCGEDLDAVRAALRDFPRLWAELAEQTTVRAAGGAPAGDGSAQVLPPAVQARSLIRATLATWCRVLETDHGIAVPDETLIRRRTTLDVAEVEFERDVALHAWRRHPSDRPGRADHHRRAAEHAARAAELRNRRAGDVDVIDALRDHLDRHLHTLLGDGRTGRESQFTHAQTFAEDVLDVRNRARNIANPRRGVVPIPCSCGAVVHLDVDRERTYRCPGCGTTGTLDEWRRWEAPDASEALPLSRLPGWLARGYGIEVTVKQLRNWRDRGAITPLECCLPPGGLGPHRPGCTQLFDPNAVLLIARHRLEGKRSA